MLSTINSIVAIKKLLPVIERDRDVQGGLTTGERQLREASWTTEDSANCKASLGGSSSSTSSGTSINTRVRATATTSTITESATALHHRPPVATRKVKTLKTMKTACVRELGAEMCTPEDKKKPARLQNLPTRRKLVETKTPQRQNTHNRAICNESKSCVKHHNSCIAVGDAATRFWVPQSKAAVNSTRTPVSSRPLRGFPSLQPESSPATALDLQNLKAALHELKSIVLKGQAGLSEELASTQAQVSRLQELCAVTYVSVDDGTRDLALKADQLASWVQLERKLDVGQIRAMMEEVLAAAPRSVSVSD
ncbi:hypothetical protein EGW08_006959 [Elysia chlorotica]|uniref:Uncharacterized protein n=1 Tax=Elysia chlorotica TaxID=188477 RepID=A0A3S1BCR4_ELYCH|nr:hypothetical protein EGW08_006959 [Elysia chlorotica]